MSEETNKETEQEIMESENKYSLNNLSLKENSIKIVDMMIVLGVYFLVPKILAKLIPFFVSDITTGNARMIVIALNISISIVSLLLIFGIKYYRNFKLFGREKIENTGWVKPMLIFSYAIFTLTVPTLILKVLGNTDSSGGATSNNQDVLTTVSEKSPPIFIFILIVLLAPILEEIVFRALPLFYKPKNDKYNTKIMAVIRLIVFSLLFGLMHNPNNYIEVLSYASGGFFLGLVVLLTNRLETAILVHMINNYLGYIALYS